MVKTFIVHLETMPTATAGSLLETDGNQALRVNTLAPSGAQARLVTEGGTAGQIRAEVDATGAAQSYFLHALQARGSADPDLTAQVTEDAQSFHVTLKHPTKGTATIVFAKGMTSTGGEFGFAATGTPQTAPLGTGIQTMTISNSGPSWQP